MVESFGAQVRAEVAAIEGALTTIFRESLQRLVTELNTLVPVGQTAFLRSSLQADKTSLPDAVRENPGMADAEFVGVIELVINGTEFGETLYIGYTANYAARRHYGFVGQDSLGRTYNETGKPWVTMAAQRWERIVSEVETELFARLGLS